MQRRYGAVDSALAALLGELAAQGLVSPDPMAMPIAKAREGNVAYLTHIGANSAEVADITLRDIPGPAGVVPVKIVRPHGADIPAPAVLYLHGGGFAFGDLDTHEGLMRELAVRSGAVVVAPHYRRTPEHPFPAPFDDSLAAWRWLIQPSTCTTLGLDARRLGMAGDSAGGNLVLALLAFLRDAGETLPAAAAIIYGMLSLRDDTKSHQTYAVGPGLTSARLKWFWDHYIPNGARSGAGGGVGATDARAVPWLASLEGLPPLALFVAECDVLADDTWDLTPRLDAAGVRYTLDAFPGMTHGFIQLSQLFAPASDALSVIGRRIAEGLGAPGSNA